MLVYGLIIALYLAVPITLMVSALLKSEILLRKEGGASSHHADFAGLSWADDAAQGRMRPKPRGSKTAIICAVDRSQMLQSSAAPN